ncbi:uncharacterized protein LOC113338511 [Papaver somniferum]|uniref:uncharacterized protein LOC113338511 n=1 Tax=Papaver somniferum TaxID=3469 RepID=UPI000E6F9DE2|nr:uncharacterized protein LOC113338511 [Papaver somniferum]
MELSEILSAERDSDEETKSDDEDDLGNTSIDYDNDHEKHGEEVKSFVPSIKIRFNQNTTFKYWRTGSGCGQEDYYELMDKLFAISPSRSFSVTGSSGKIEVFMYFTIVMKSYQRPLYTMNGITKSIVLMDEEELKEWVAQVELGLLFMFVSMPEGGNDLMQICFRCRNEMEYNVCIG